MIVLLIFVFMGIAFYEIPPLIRKKYWRDLVIFSSFFLFAFSISCLQIIGVKLPNPIDILTNMVKLLHVYRFTP